MRIFFSPGKFRFTLNGPGIIVCLCFCSSHCVCEHILDMAALVCVRVRVSGVHLNCNLKHSESKCEIENGDSIWNYMSLGIFLPQTFGLQNFKMHLLCMCVCWWFVLFHTCRNAHTDKRMQFHIRRMQERLVYLLSSNMNANFELCWSATIRSDHKFEMRSESMKHIIAIDRCVRRNAVQGAEWHLGKKGAATVAAMDGGHHRICHVMCVK